MSDPNICPHPHHIHTPLINRRVSRNRTPVSDRVIMKKQGIKRARSLSRVDPETAMEVDAKMKTKKTKPGRDISGLRDAKQVRDSLLGYWSPQFVIWLSILLRFTALDRRCEGCECVGHKLPNSLYVEIVTRSTPTTRKGPQFFSC